jgi:hypothetical protein
MSQQSNDPMDFLRSMWGGKGFTLPGMITPTLDTEELDKRIKDLKTVEGWLRTNLSMLQMTIQNLEMQSTTLSAVKTMSQMYSDQSTASKPGKPASSGAAKPGISAGSQPGAGDAAGSLAQAAMWPWSLMQQMQDQMHHAAEVAASKAPPAAKNGGAAAAAGKAEDRSATSAAAARSRRKPGSES